MKGKKSEVFFSWAKRAGLEKSVTERDIFLGPGKGVWRNRHGKVFIAGEDRMNVRWRGLSGRAEAWRFRVWWFLGQEVCVCLIGCKKGRETGISRDGRRFLICSHLGVAFRRGGRRCGGFLLSIERRL